MSDEEEDWSDYDSGPFCIHWSDPTGCEQIGAACGLECRSHWYGSPGACEEFQNE